MSTLNYIKKPKLKNPILIAGFPGIANIGKVSVEYLTRELNSEKFLEVYSEHLPEWAIKEDDMVKMLRVDFYYARPEGSVRDVVLVTSDAQAVMPYGQYVLSSELVDIAMQHDVGTIVTTAAYVLSPHEFRKGVIGTATDHRYLGLLRKHGVDILDGGVIVGMNGIIVGLAGIRGLNGICLLGATKGGLLDIYAAEEVLRVVSSLFKLKFDFKNIHKYAPSFPKFKSPKLGAPVSLDEEVSYIW